MTQILKLHNTLCWQRCRRDTYCKWECKLVRLLQRATWQYLPKLYMHTSSDVVKNLLGIYSTNTLAHVWKDIHVSKTLRVVCKSKVWKPSKSPSKGLFQHIIMHPYTRILWSHLKRFRKFLMYCYELNSEICSIRKAWCRTVYRGCYNCG